MTICLSAGHGAGDPGAVHKDLTEEALTKAITKRAVEMIRKHGVGCLEVPDNLTLIQTIQWINARGDQIDICVDVHINSGGGTGVEGWNYQGGPNESDKLSQTLANCCAIETGLPNRGIKDESTNRFGKLGFIHDTDPIAALIECGFIDGDYNFLRVDSNLTKMAQGVARGCLAYLGIKWNPALLISGIPAPQSPPPPTLEQQLQGARAKIIELEKQVAVLSKRPESCPTPSYGPIKQEIANLLSKIP